jgi:glycosyltransferase involved in cell wall biosynthesis
MEAAAVRRAERLIFDSAAGLAAVLGPAGDPRALVIEYGAALEHVHDPHVLDSLGLRPRGYFLVVARIEPENHVLEIVRAHARTQGLPGLLVVGDIERSGRYGARVRAAAGRGARFLGPVYDASTLHALRRAAAAVVHGHSVGGTNPALLEAMAAGALVLAHDNAFNREVLGDGAACFASEDALVGLLAGAARLGEAERARIAERQRARIRERYTWERIAAEYAELLGAPGGAGREPSARGEQVPAALPSSAPHAPRGAARR